MTISRSRNLWLRGISAAVFLAFWEIGAMVADSRFLPDPLTVAVSLYGHATSGELPYHVGVTLARVAVSFFVAMAIGTAIGIFMGASRRGDIALDALLILALNIPALVTIILCYIWFGLTEFAAVLAVSINKIPIVVVNLREGARALDRDLLQVGQTFRVGRWRTFLHIYLPQLYPYLMASVRSGLALIWKIVLVVELLGRSNGVGFKLSEFFQFFDITSILAYSFAFIAVVMVIEFLLIGPIDRRLTLWRP